MQAVMTPSSHVIVRPSRTRAPAQGCAPCRFAVLAAKPPFNIQLMSMTPLGGPKMYFDPAVTTKWQVSNNIEGIRCIQCGTQLQ